MARSRRKPPEVTTTVVKEDFLNTLNSVQSGIATKEAMLQATSFVFQNGYVTTFNDDIAMTCPIGLSDEFKFAVDAGTLLNFLKKVKNKKLELSLSGQKLLINGKFFMTGLVVNKINMPIDQLNFTEDRDWFDIPTDLFYYLRMAASVCSKDKEKKIFMHVHITDECIEACDNSHIMFCEFKTGLKKNNDALISAKNVIELCKHDGFHKYHVSNSWITFINHSGLQFACRNVVESFPSLAGILDKKLTIKPTTIHLPKELTESVKRASVFKTEEKHLFGIELLLADNNIIINAKNDYGFHNESIDIDFEGDIGFTINPDYLLYILESTDTLEYHKKSNSISFDDNDVTHLVMLKAVKRKK